MDYNMNFMNSMRDRHRQKEEGNAEQQREREKREIETNLREKDRVTDKMRKRENQKKTEADT